MVTVGTIALCSPAMYLLNRYVPQLMGRLKVKGLGLVELV